MATRKDVLDLAVKIYFEKGCTVKEAAEEAREQLDLTDKQVYEILEGK